jgi:hypothetical protein
MTEEATTYPLPLPFEYSVFSESESNPGSSIVQITKRMADEHSPINTKLQFSPESSLVTEFSKPAPVNFMIYEAELYRIKPSPPQKCIARWCVLSSLELLMYRNMYSHLAREKPLVLVPVLDIASIEFLTPGKDCSFYRILIALRTGSDCRSMLSTYSNETKAKAPKSSWPAQRQPLNSLMFAVMHKSEFEKWEHAFKQLL